MFAGSTLFSGPKTFFPIADKPLRSTITDWLQNNWPQITKDNPNLSTITAVYRCPLREGQLAELSLEFVTASAPDAPRVNYALLQRIINNAFPGHTLLISLKKTPAADATSLYETPGSATNPRAGASSPVA